MRGFRLGLGLTCCLATATAGTNAFAQKSKDTLRIAVTESVSRLSAYYFPQPDGNFFYKELFDNLVNYDEMNKKFVPGLAKSWQRVDDTTLDFELRDDIVFHNGNKLDAEDVAYTLRFAMDPKYNFPFKNRYTGSFKGAEVLGPNKVRIQFLKIEPFDMFRLLNLYVYDSETHAPLEDKSQYEVKGTGTGPMKLTSFDAGRLIVMEKFKDYKLGDVSTVGSIVGRIIPDKQTQVAELLTGSIDLMRDPSRDQVLELEKDLRFKASVSQALDLQYLALDSVNRTGETKALTDQRVRRAIFMSIDRQALVKSLGMPHASTKLIDALCMPDMVACKWTVGVAPYNPAMAKQLLKEAGVADGFDLELSTDHQSREMSEAIAGELRKVGIKASVKQLTNVAMTQQTRDGKVQARVGAYTGLALPDSHFPMQIFFEQPATDYWRDAVVAEAGLAAASTRDMAERERNYARMYDRINEQAYFLPIQQMPVTYMHSKDVVYQRSSLNLFSARAADFRWSK
jgi:peptide/nickel transport system substrate-binding protein